ncbi:MAG: copper resistance protein CopC [Acidobacteria bacterium]|nr:copper resistance protein CopC [Acidobacteriota bacterium]
MISAGSRSLSRAAIWLLAMVTLLALLTVALVSAPAASAHDVLESTNPADGSTVTSVPSKLTLTFDNTPAAIGSQIQILDSTGKDWADGAVRVIDHVASENIKAGAPAGTYTVNWRMVSSDSHPIDGTFSFTATSGAAPVNTASAGTAAAPQSPQQSSAPASASASGGFPWVLVVLGLVLVALVAGIGIFVKRRLGAGED